MSEQELIELNLKVAAIAGWTDIKIWDEKAIRKTLVGTNLTHPEMGIFVPNYVNDLNAIAKVLNKFKIDWTVSANGDAFSLTEGKKGLDHEAYGKTPAIALCKLLLAIMPDPDPTQPRRKTEIVEASFS